VAAVELNTASIPVSRSAQHNHVRPLEHHADLGERLCVSPCQAAGVIADTVIDLVGTIGRHVLNNLMPNRRLRTNPRVVKRAISKFVAKTAQGRIRGPSYKATISIDILTPVDP